MTVRPSVSARNQPCWRLKFCWLQVCACVALFAPAARLRADPTVTVDGSQTYQTIAGFGANINHRNWTNSELQPVIDAMVDQAGMTIFRIIFDNSDWEATNDNSDPDVMNWAYYNQVYASGEFQRLWGLTAYLNQKGITNGVMFNFQGFGPAWMMESDGATLASGEEDEWAEMIASLLIYARTNMNLQFSLVGPDNEEDNGNPEDAQGILMSSPSQYVTALHYLVEKLQANGMTDVGLVVPDLISSAPSSEFSWWAEVMTDPVVMSQVAHFGLHTYDTTTDYDDGGGSDGMAEFLQDSPYPGTDFWVTEFNIWCSDCSSGPNDNGWDYFRGTAEYMLAQLANGATACLVWEGYDGYYLSSATPDDYYLSTWGIFQMDDPGDYPGEYPTTYSPRPNFYTLAQIAKFVRPGAQRIDASGSFSPLQAFFQTNSGALAITGVNTSADPATFTVALTNLPAFSSLELYYTDSTTNLCDAGPVDVTDGMFQVTVPADCVFTIANGNTTVPAVLNISATANSIVLTWPSPLGGYGIESATNLTPPIAWSALTNSPETNGGQLRVVVTPAGSRQYFRLHQF
jgi:O-glycosyl hydrolase